MPTIIPTHSCFDDALDFFEVVIDPEALRDVHDHFRIAHGVCYSLEAKRPYAHAWVEQYDCSALIVANKPGEVVPERLVWQAGTVEGEDVYFGLDMDSFLVAYRVQFARRYDLIEAARLNLETGHYGPWLSPLAQLAGTQDGEMFGQVTALAPTIVVRVDRSLASGGRKQP